MSECVEHSELRMCVSSIVRLRIFLPWGGRGDELNHARPFFWPGICQLIGCNFVTASPFTSLFSGAVTEPHHFTPALSREQHDELLHTAVAGCPAEVQDRACTGSLHARDQALA